MKNYLYPDLNMTPASAILPVQHQGATIPRVLHQTFHSKSNLPQEIEQNIDKIQKINPEWEYRLYDDVDIAGFIDDHYGQRILAYFNRINPKYGAARADLFRYLLIYKCGGAYLDIKSSLERPLNSVLNDDDQYLLSHWGDNEENKYSNWGHCPELAHVPNGEFQQWHVIAIPGHPFLKAVIENILRNIDKYDPALHGVGKPAVLRVTGPIAYTLAIAPLLHLHQHRIACSKSEIGLEYSIYNQINDHKVIFTSHYSQLREPLIRTGSIRKMLSLAIRIQRKIASWSLSRN